MKIKISDRISLDFRRRVWSLQHSNTIHTYSHAINHFELDLNWENEKIIIDSRDIEQVYRSFNE